jgi:uncharacterized protein (DUF342 family)
VGAVVGGNIASMKSMHLHSVGTIASQTQISCAVDMSIYEMLKGLRTLVPVLKQKIAAIQSKIGINLTGANILKRLQTMPEQQKQVMKKLLLEMKNTVKLLEETEEKRKILEEKAFIPEGHEAAILVYNKLIPVVKVRIREAFYPLYQEFYARKIVLEQGTIVTVPLRSSER